MRFGLIVTLFFGVALGFAAPDVTVFRKVNVIAMDGAGVMPSRDVVVREGRIVSVLPHLADATFADARLIEASGQFLIPGLVDAHAHMPDGSDGDWPIDAYLQSNLDAGVTTLRSMRGHPQQLMWRAEVLDGSRVGPHLYLSAPPLRRTDAERGDVAALLAAYAAAGYDFIKLLSGFDAEQFPHLVVAAEAAGLPITGHVPTAGIEAGVAAGMRSIEHMRALTVLRLQYGEGALRKLAAAMRLHNVYVCPTFETYEVTKAIYQNQDLIALRQVAGIPEPVAETWRARLRDYAGKVAEKPANYMVEDDYLSKHYLTGRILMEEKVGMLVSPSQWSCLKPGAAMLVEMRHFERMGMTREAILMAATVQAAKALDAAADFGQVKAGRRADLVLLRANPLDDLAALEQISGVMLHGRWLPGDADRS